MNKNSGITLVALVVTIIVLLILATVSINLVLGENGIITKAREAKENTEISEIEEYNDLTNIETQIDISTYDETKKMKILINSGEDGVVTIPILDHTNDYVIDWGDGTNSKMAVKNKCKDIKIASIDELQVGLLMPPPESNTHIYEELNIDYVVSIMGKVETINAAALEENESAKIIKILQWGELGLKKMSFNGCLNLTEIASPTENSFLEMIDFQNAFWDCTSLKKIPENFFDNAPNATYFYSAFQNCTSLTGNAVPLWDTEFKGINATRHGGSCYRGCTGLDNYDSIPNSWK